MREQKSTVFLVLFYLLKSESNFIFMLKIKFCGFLNERNGGRDSFGFFNFISYFQKYRVSFLQSILYIREV